MHGQDLLQGGFTRREFLMRTGLVTFGLAGLPLLGNLEQAHAAPVSPRRGGTLRYGTVSAVGSLDPHLFAGAAPDALLGMVYSRLVQLKPDWNDVEPDLAHQWEVSPNRKAYTFHLRPGVSFHDGSTLTTEDVLFSFQRIMEPKTGAYVRSFLTDVLEEVTAPDDSTVRFVLKKPFAALLTVLALPTASVVSKKWVTQGANPSVSMMGTGPMKFVSLEPNVRVTLTRHARYFERSLPYLDGINMLFLPDETSRTTALRSGTADFIDFVPWKDMATVKADANLRLYSDSVSSGEWAFFRVARPPLDNLMIRQAINWAVNREAVLRTSFFGYGAILDDVFVPKTSWAYTSGLPKYGFDPDKAKDLIRRSGVPTPIRLDIIASGNLAFERSVGQVLEANLRDAGFDARLQLMEFAEKVSRLFRGDSQIMVWGGGPAYADPDYLYLYFDSNGTFGRAAGYANSQVSLLLNEARSTTSRNRRKSLYAQVYKVLLEDAPWLSLCYREQAEASAMSVQGYTRVLGSNWNGVRIAKVWLSR